MLRGIFSLCYSLFYVLYTLGSFLLFVPTLDSLRILYSCVACLQSLIDNPIVSAPEISFFGPLILLISIMSNSNLHIFTLRFSHFCAYLRFLAFHAPTCRWLCFFLNCFLLMASPRASSPRNSIGIKYSSKCFALEDAIIIVGFEKPYFSEIDNVVSRYIRHFSYDGSIMLLYRSPRCLLS